MDLLPKITGYDQGFLSWDHWPYFLAVVVVLGILILVVLLVYFLWKRRNARDGEKKEKQKSMPVSSLVKAWKEFLKEIPWTVRPNILAYEHFIVFGEASAGKSALIDNYTGWEGHARQFYPSYTKNPLLQVYLGSRVLVQEIPPSLLGDTSEHARRAMIKLWKPLFKRKDPTVVIVLNGQELQTDEPEYLEYLKQKAQIIRGKINLLEQIRKKPIKVRIALTYMDQMEGFFEFSQFLGQNHIPLTLEFSSGDITDISGCLDPYEAHLSRALKSLPADKYLKAITFMRQAPKLFQYLSVFITFLQNPDPLSLEPEVTQFYLTSQTDGQPPVLNPFAPSITTQDIKKIDPHFKHRLAAVAIGMAGLAYLGGAYFYQRSLISEKYREIAAVEVAPPSRYDQKMHALLPVTYMHQHLFMKLPPDFFPETKREITRRCIENIRKLYLFPAVDSVSAEMATNTRATAGQSKKISSFEQQYRGKIEDAQDKAIYLLALIYATRDNELGKLIQNNLDPWSQLLNMPKTMIEDYVNDNDSSWQISLNVNKLSFRRSKSIVDDPHSWKVFFTDIGRVCQQPVLTRPEFDNLQKKTDIYFGLIQQLGPYDLFVKIVELLKKEAPRGINLEVIAEMESDIRQEPVKNFLKFIKNSNMGYPEVTDKLGLTGLLENLNGMLDYKAPQGEKELQFRFLFGGEEFKFDARQWNDLLHRSRITLFLREFINHYKRRDGLLFFPSDKEFDDLVMNASNDGRFLFIGQARVDGRFTKEAIEKRVRPILTELPAIVENLPVSPKDKSHFSTFLFKEVDLYGRRYAQYYRKYYMEFDIKAESPGALRFVLGQMVLPSSPLREVLLTLGDNTQIDDPGQNEYMRSFALNMAEFDFIKRLMGEQKGMFPELDKYKALLEQMQMDMQDQQQEPAANKDKDEPFTLFKNRLSPLGRISFAIFNNEKDSFLNLVKLWLDSVGVPRQWQDVFLAPVWQAYFLGITEIETEIGKIWADLRQNDIQPLYTKFPFEFSSTEDISADALRNATHPSGHFWQTYQGMLAPFCVEEGRRWREKKGPFNLPKLPPDMLTKVNAVAKISSVLWDKEGKERPFEIMLKPGLLPSVLPGEPLPAVSYLNVGDSAVFGFNQKPSWKILKYNWQNTYWAAVGIEFTAKDKSARIKKTIEIPTSYWSFFRLLKKTKEYSEFSTYAETGNGGRPARTISGNDHGKEAEESQTVRWVINSPATNMEGRPMEIMFTIQGDPWAVFNLPR